MTVNSFKIDNDVPIPEERGTKNSRYPFRLMGMGDSVLLTDLTMEVSFRNAAHAYGRANGWKFTLRKCDEGIRCWRIQ